MPPFSMPAAVGQRPRHDDHSLEEQRFRSVLLLQLALPGKLDAGWLQANHDDGRAQFLRAATGWRDELESFDYVHREDTPGLLHFSRPYGWHCVTNVGSSPAPLPEGLVVISSAPLLDGYLPPAATVWLLRWVE